MPPPAEPIPEDDRNALRTLAYWIANGTLLISTREDLDYLPRLQAPGPWLGGIFAAWFREDLGGDAALPWWIEALDPARPDPALLELPEGPRWRRAVCEFMDDFGQRLLEPAVLEGVDPLELLDGEGGSPLEAVVAVYLNHLDLDPAGEVEAEARGRWRACQMLRAWVDSTYAVEPPWEDWETVLP